MHQKTKQNTKLFTRIRYFSYSIPLACIMTLLVGLVYGTCFILPEFREVYAAEIASSTASMSITNPTLSNTITPNNTTYVSTNVTIDAKYIQSYSLKISGDTNLSGPSTITGAGGKTPASMANSTWGYNWGNTGTTDSSLTYSSLSTSGTSLALNTLNSSTGSANFTKKLTFAVKFGEADTGHYTGKVNLAFTATPKTLVGYSVSYNVNGGLGGPSDYSEHSYDTSKSYTIPTTEPTREGYKFLGWSTSSTATTADTNYAPGKTISLTSSSPTRTLYAVWEKPLFGGITTMQEMTSDICTASAIGDSETLKDTRDNNTYTVTKLADGKCWMTQNLRLVNKTLTSSDSNVNANFTIPFSASWTDTSTTGNHAYYKDTDYGAYYTWYTATAGTSASTYDICPKGWRLPTGGSSGEFQALYNKGYSSWTTNNSKNGHWLGGSSSSASGAAFFPAAGYVNTSAGTLDRVTNAGYYWSSTPNSSNAHSLYFDSSVYPAASSGRYFGDSVRCVAK